jgi:phosphoribosylaminoimidazole carboxylase (NCAIR synthetase)
MGLGSIVLKLKAVKKFKKELDKGKIYAAAIRKKKKVVLDWNREDQLFKDGINNDGTKIQEYRPATVAFKEEKGQPTNRVTLRDTGSFHKSFYLIFQPESFSIYAKDPKTPEITKAYRRGFGGRGAKIFGLTSENKKKLLNEIIMPALTEKIKEL